MKQKTVRFGIIGCGLMGRELGSAAARWCHLPEMAVKPELVAVCDQAPATMEWFTGNFNIGQATADYRELLDNDEVDAVYCAVPHDLHAQMYVDIIEAGKHLFGEKPFGIDRQANAGIMAAVRSRPDLVVRCSSQFPFFPAVQRMVRMIRDEGLGTILEVESGFLHCSDMNPDKPINWKRMVEKCGQYGVLGDLGLHVFHVPLRMGWKPANVRAILSNVIPKRRNAAGEMVPCETWDNGTLFCEVPHEHGDFPLTAKVQRIGPGETNNWYLTIKGTRRSARFTTKRPRQIETLVYEPGGDQVWATEDLGYQSVYKAISGGIFEFGFCDAILQMFAAFCDQVLRGPDADLPFGCATADEAAATHDIFTAALESQKTKQVVRVGGSSRARQSVEG